MTKLTIDDFIKKAKLAHGDKYDYSQVNYINNHTKVKIVCKNHGIFLQKPNSHMSKKDGCPKCKIDGMYKSNDQFIKDSIKIHGEIFTYDRCIYRGINNIVTITCNKHGDFDQIAYQHLNVKNCCTLCRAEQKFNKDEFIKRAKVIHSDRYDYSLVNYINSRTKIDITCKNHGIFTQTPNNHLREHGCPKCNRSKGEIIIENYLIENNILYETEYKFQDLRYKYPLRFDFAILDNNKNIKFLIEFNGKQHYKYFEVFHNSKKDYEKSKERDKLKIEYCDNNKIKLLIIKHTDNIIEKLIKYYEENK